SAPTTLAGDDVKAITASPHHNWLNDAVRLNRSRQIIQPRVVHLPSRLKRVRHEAIDVDFERAEPRFGGIGNERAEAFAESGAFVHKLSTAEFADHAEFLSQTARGAVGMRRGDLVIQLDFAKSARSAVLASHHATTSARRSSSSRARLRYASAPRDFG